MAELPSLGEHCAHPPCRRLDFLPVECRACARLFCREHYLRDDHECATSQDVGTETKEAVPGVECSLGGCSKRELVEIKCHGCGAHFCLMHRHGADHGCAKHEEEEGRRKEAAREMSGTREMLARIASSGGPEGNKPVVRKKKARNIKSQRMAAKVQLMKLKLKSEGSSGLPQEERVYFRVVPPTRLKKESRGVFVSRTWTLGKAVDSAASVCGAENRNNEQGEERLRLFRLADGRNLCCCPEKSEEGMSLPLSRLVEAEEVFNGDALVLEYVPPSEEAEECEQIDTSSYPKK